MGWLDALRGRQPVVDEARWVMLDVETSGLDPQRDRLLAIAAIAMRIDPAWRNNILLHGIGVQRQQQGVAPVEAMQAFANFVGTSPLLAFHAAFDRALISRSARQHLGGDLPNPWVDIEQLCAVTHEKVRARSLDEWMTHFGIVCAVRHQAAADTLAECEVLQRIWPKVAAQCENWRDVHRLAAQQRWVARA
jgi:DNA polymerase III subunit epsilon